MSVKISKTQLLIVRMLDKVLPEIVLVGIQPERMETSLELSETINKVVPQAIEVGLSQLRAWGIRAAKIPFEKQTSVLQRSV